jgi:hypothetical protein
MLMRQKERKKNKDMNLWNLIIVSPFSSNPAVVMPHLNGAMKSCPLLGEATFIPRPTFLQAINKL